LVVFKMISRHKPPNCPGEWLASDQKRHWVISNEQSLLCIGPSELAATENR
jgi:hypothetical protein